MFKERGRECEAVGRVIGKKCKTTGLAGGSISHLRRQFKVLTPQRENGSSKIMSFKVGLVKSGLFSFLYLSVVKYGYTARILYSCDKNIIAKICITIFKETTKLHPQSWETRNIIYHTKSTHSDLMLYLRLHCALGEIMASFFDAFCEQQK